MSTDPSVRFRQLVDNALSYLTWHEEVVLELGVEGISQIWDDEPAWYFWMNGRAYLLRYPGLEEEGDELTAVLHAFPTRGELDRGDFSPAERRLLVPGCFDRETTTPRFESFARFADAFILGEMTVLSGKSGPASLAVSVYRDKWEPAWRFTEVFVALQSFYWKTAPVVGPVEFAPQPGIRSVLVAFDEPGAEKFLPMVGTGPTRRLPYPDSWRRLAHGMVCCSATGSCSCCH